MVKEIPQKSPVPVGREPSTVHLYSSNDPIPVADAVESDTDTAWSLWEDSVSPPGDGSDTTDTTFANTVPADLTPLPPDKLPKRRP